MSRLIRIAGSLLIVVGVGLLAWAITVWQWQDPVTAVVNRVEQRELAESLERSFENRRPVTGSDVASAAERRRALELEAGAWRRAAKEGDAIAKLRIERLGLDAVVVNGTRSSTLKRGPGRYLGSAMPGQGELVYIAGHRTTYGAPFSRIDHLRKGDRIFLELPYGTFEYAVTGSRIVASDELSVLRSKGREQLVLQACHPRFFASHRFIVYAKPTAFTPPASPNARAARAGGRGAGLPRRDRARPGARARARRRRRRARSCATPGPTAARARPRRPSILERARTSWSRAVLARSGAASVPVRYAGAGSEAP